MSEPVIRFMRLKDVDQVAEIEQATFARPWSRESFRQEVTRNAVARYLVAEDLFCLARQVAEEVIRPEKITK